MVGVVQTKGRGALQCCAASFTPPEERSLLFLRRQQTNWKEVLRRQDQETELPLVLGGGGSCNLRGGLGPGSLTDHSSFSKTHTHSSSGVSETRLDPHSSFSSSRRRFGSTGVTGTSRRICSYSEAAPETRAGNKHTCGSAGTRMSHRARFFSVSQQRPGAGFHGYHE